MDCVEAAIHFRCPVVLDIEQNRILAVRKADNELETLFRLGVTSIVLMCHDLTSFSILYVNIGPASYCSYWIQDGRPVRLLTIAGHYGLVIKIKIFNCLSIVKYVSIA